MSGRLLIVGDIHGQYEALQRVLEYVHFRPEDRLVFLGDYINRGKNSKAVMDFMCELSGHGRHIFLRGNHEDILLKLLSGENEYWYTWLEYGGRECLRSYSINPENIYFQNEGYFHNGLLLDRTETMKFMQRILPSSHIRFINRTVISYTSERFFFCHAGIETGLKLSEQGHHSEHFLLWGDEEFLQDTSEYEKVVVFGHYHHERPLIMKNKIGLALIEGVAILDTSNMTITDSAGRTMKVEIKT